MSAANAPVAHPHPISLAIGEPAEGAPPPVIEAAVRALREGRARYGPPAGLPRLRELVAEDLARKTGLPWLADEVIVTAGGKPALLDTMRCILEPGDEVLVLAPYWPSFLDQVAWAGGTAVVVAPGADLLPDPDAIAAACGPRTKVLILNDPSNPTSRALAPELLARIAAVAERADLWLLVDQVYVDLALEGEHRTLLRVAPEVKERTVVVESFSKRFAMTGLRLGAAAGPEHLIAAMTRLASASTTHPNMIAQYAGIAALEMDDEWIEAQRTRYRRRRDRALAGLAGIEGVQCARAECAFYLFPAIGRWMAARGTARDTDVTDALRAQGLLLVPGSAFGAPGHLRLSYGLADEELDEALGRLRRFFA
ncbi:MAG: aminotransferase class I/II-fold pyridoxal phosphate-dependent enzyme [Planctomycetota bacterium]|nr:MAG: aminotransferase class I/II-fold pyridoxal phosphate-dependent enzyme [Planctomycetota bacterium]